MQRAITHLSMGLALLLAGFATLGLAQNQVKGSWGKANTKGAPAVAIDQNGTKYVAWNKSGSNQILVATSPADSKTWTLLGISEGGAGVVGGTDWTAGTNLAPALSFDSNTNQIWLAFKGQSIPTDGILVSQWTGSSWTNQEAVSTSAGKPLTGYAPALSGGSGISLAWKGASTSNDDIWTTSWTGSEWAPQAKVEGTTWTAGSSTTPAWTQTFLQVGVSPNLIWKGGSPNLWWTAGSGTAWNEQQQIHCEDPVWTAQTIAAPAATENNNGYSADVVFWTTSSFSIEYTYTDGSGCGWAPPETVRSAKTEIGPAATLAPNFSYFLLAWTKTNGQVWYTTFDQVPMP